jgi:GDP-L-fucose synthase
MDSNSKVFVAGHKGLVGSAIIRNLEKKSYKNVYWISRDNCDLRNKESVDAYFKQAKPEYVFLAAAKVGGIGGNLKYPAEFIYDNLMIQTNIIDAAYRNGVKKLLFLGSSCIYPKFPKIPITEDQLMTSPLEESNSAYAIAKIAGMRMCQAYKEQYGLNAISLMPTNLYGINDNFDLENSHVLPAMIRKFHEAEDKVTLWGDGSAMREFLYVDDLAEACYVCMQKYEDDEHINVGTGEDVTIKELAETVAKVVGNKSIEWDTSKPNGTPRKVLNVDKIKSLGWEPKIKLKEGIESTYTWYKENLL